MPNMTDHLPDESDSLKSIERPVSFTQPELVLIHTLVRHESQDERTWRFPPTSKSLNEDIAGALLACDRYKLEEYTLLLSKGDLLVIDYWVRYDMKTPEGAKGKDILLKIFQARDEMNTGLLVGQDEEDDDSYTGAMKRASDLMIASLEKEKEVTEDATNKPDNHADPNPDSDAVT